MTHRLRSYRNLNRVETERRTYSSPIPSSGNSYDSSTVILYMNDCHGPRTGVSVCRGACGLFCFALQYCTRSLATLDCVRGHTHLYTSTAQFSHITHMLADISGPVGSKPLPGSRRRHWNISWSKPLKAHAPCVMHIHHACSTVVVHNRLML